MDHSVVFYFNTESKKNLDNTICIQKFNHVQSLFFTAIRLKTVKKKKKTHTIGTGNERTLMLQEVEVVSQSDWAGRKARLGFDARNITNERGTCQRRSATFRVIWDQTFNGPLQAPSNGTSCVVGQSLDTRTVNVTIPIFF